MKIIKTADAKEIEKICKAVKEPETLVEMFNGSSARDRAIRAFLYPTKQLSKGR